MQVPPDDPSAGDAWRLQLERYADGEMTPAETAAFEAKLSSDPALAAQAEAVLAARAGLARALKRVMAVEAPAELRGRVQTALAEACEDDDGVVRPAFASWWQGPHRANIFAVAASLALVAGAVLFGIFGPRIRDRASDGGDTSVAEVAATIATEHETCAARGTCVAQPRPWRSREEASSVLSAMLGRAVTVPDLEEAGYSFCCGGPCRMPGAGDRAGHLLYCRLDDRTDGCRWLSVFVAPVETPFVAYDPFGRAGPLQCGIDYFLLTPGTGEMHYWCDGSATWFVKPSDGAEYEMVRDLFPQG